MPIRSLNNAYSAHRTGANRPARPAQIADAALNQLSGGVDPQQLDEMAHATAQALLARVRASEDPELVQRVLTLVDREGVDIIAELWAKSMPDTLPGILWRLYALRTWMRRNGSSLPHLWTLGEPTEGAASAITGIEEYPTADDIAATADSILAGAFAGDFAVALDRAGVFVTVIARGLMRRQRVKEPNKPVRTLLQTAGVFRNGADLWRRGQLD